jgi:polysaccharide biosynthesis protein PslG
MSTLERRLPREIPFDLPSAIWSFVSVIALIILITLRSMPSSDLASLVTLPLHAAGITTNQPVYGFSTSLDKLTPAQLDAKLNGMQATGTKWVRFDMGWNVVQPTDSGTYNWSTYDAIVTAIHNRGMNAVGVIDFTPSWARQSNCPPSTMCPPAPAYVQDYANFATAAAQRYAPYGVHDWEIWNEPNIYYRFRPATDPALYSMMLKASYTGIKAAEPSDTVIVGGTAPSETDASNLKPADFIAALYRDGDKGYFDAIAAHPYTYPNSPAAGLPDAWGQMTDMHNVMAANGDGNKQIWITEFGSPTNGPNVANDHVSEASQAQILADALRIWKTYSWSGPFFYYDYQDAGTGTWNSENFYGLVRADGSHKPSYDIWTKAVSQN